MMFRIETDCWLFCCLVAVGLTLVGGQSQPSDYYTAGVVEFRPIVAGMSSADMLAEHLKAYLEIINSIEANATDILIFPEGTLNNLLQPTFVPSSDASSAPCDSNATTNYADFLIQLSCAARKVRKYLVINLTEQEKCPTDTADPRPCASNGLNVYNTNVVFDRDGRVVSRYRKVHIYVEAKNTTWEPEFGIFETDFGVKFGHFICFDVLFYTPALELVVRHGVRDIIFPSLFYSELPFLTAVQLQQSWAWATDVNFLAAGASYPQTATTGSGIYAGNAGQLISLMADQNRGGERRLLVARLPKRASTRQAMSASSVNRLELTDAAVVDLPLMRDPKIEQFNSILLDLAASVGHIEEHDLCHNGHCCHFDIQTTTVPTIETLNGSQSYQYRLGVFSGERSYEQAEFSNLRVCALYACLNESTSSCAMIFPANASVTAPYRFQTLRITGDFVQSERLLLMPNSLTRQLYPLEPEMAHWTTTEKANVHQVRFQLNDSFASTVDDLLTFGIYANYYDKSAAATKNTITITITKIMLPVLLVLCYRRWP